MKCIGYQSILKIIGFVKEFIRILIRVYMFSIKYVYEELEN